LLEPNNVENWSMPEAAGLELGALDDCGWALVCEVLANTNGSTEGANGSVFGPEAPMGPELGFENERPAKGSTFDWDFAPMEKGSGEACLAGGGLLNMAVYEKDDLPEETAGGAGVFLAVSARLSGSDDFKLPTPCRPEGAEFCCLRGPDDRPKAPPSRSPNTSSLLEVAIPEIPVTDLDVGICPQLLPVRSTPFDWGCDCPKTPPAP
jgi:hypothetical protein